MGWGWGWGPGEIWGVSFANCMIPSAYQFWSHNASQKDFLGGWPPSKYVTPAIFPLFLSQIFTRPPTPPFILFFLGSSLPPPSQKPFFFWGGGIFPPISHQLPHPIKNERSLTRSPSIKQSVVKMTSFDFISGHLNLYKVPTSYFCCLDLN